jgi:hypothetical protein
MPVRERRQVVFPDISGKARDVSPQIRQPSPFKKLRAMARQAESAREVIF